MAKGRMISRSLGSSRKFSELPGNSGKLGEFAQLLYVLLIPHTDDFGRMSGDAFSVKYSVLPTSQRDETAFEDALAAMDRVGLVQRYHVDGDGVVLQVEQFDRHQSGLHKRVRSRFPDPPEFREVPGSSGKFREIPSEEKRTEEKGREGKGTEGARALVAVPATPARQSSADDFSDLWNLETLPPIAKCREITDKRRKAIKARLSERPLSAWLDVFRRIAASNFCRGQNDRGWVATIDWVLQPDTAAKVLEGKYDNRCGSTPLMGVGKTAGNAAALAAVLNRERSGDALV